MGCRLCLPFRPVRFAQHALHELQRYLQPALVDAVAEARQQVRLHREAELGERLPAFAVDSGGSTGSCSPCTRTMGGFCRTSSSSHSGKSSAPLSPTTPAMGHSMRGAVYSEVMHPCEKPMSTHRSGVNPYSSSSSPTYVSTDPSRLPQADDALLRPDLREFRRR